MPFLLCSWLPSLVHFLLYVLDWIRKFPFLALGLIDRKVFFPSPSWVWKGEVNLSFSSSGFSGNIVTIGY